MYRRLQLYVRGSATLITLMSTRIIIRIIEPRLPETAFIYAKRNNLTSKIPELLNFAAENVWESNNFNTKKIYRSISVLTNF